MNFFRKVYYNDKPVVLTTNKENYVINNPPAISYDNIKGISQAHFARALQLLEKRV